MRVISNTRALCRSSAASKLALVLLCLVALELVLIGHQVQPVKSLKKKIYLKKLRKILPFLALVKPKKKLILVPIPIPMYDKQHHASDYQGHVNLPHQAHTMMNGDGTSPPMSFMMMSEPNMMIESSIRPVNAAPFSPMPDDSGFGSSAVTSMMMPSMTMTIQSDGSGTMSAIELNSSGRPASPPLASSPAVSRLPASNNTVSGALIAGHAQEQQQEQQQYDYDLDGQFMGGVGNLINEMQQPPLISQQQASAGGEHYYSSPWQSSRPPPQLASPTKFLRNERLRQKQPPQRQQQQRQSAVAATAAARKAVKSLDQGKQHTIDPTRERLTDHRSEQPAMKQRHQQQLERQAQRLSAPMPVLLVKNQWRPSAGAVEQLEQRHKQEASGTSRRQNDRLQQTQRHLGEEARAMPQLSREQELQISQALEQESLVQVGPARMLPIYQSPSGRLSMTPPPPLLSRDGTGQTGTTSIGPTSDQSASNSFDSRETLAERQPDTNAEVQTIGSDSLSSDFFFSSGVSDTPTGTTQPSDLELDGGRQHTTIASEPTTHMIKDSQHSSEGATPATTMQPTTTTVNATTGVFTSSSGQHINSQLEGARSQGPPVSQQQPIDVGTKNSKLRPLDAY